MRARPRARGWAVGLVCLAVGVLINIAIAWSCVGWGALESLNSRMMWATPPGAARDVPAHGEWPIAVPADWPVAMAEGRSSSPGVDWQGGMTGWSLPMHYADRLSAGWPMKSLSWERRQVIGGAGVEWDSSRGAGPTLPRSQTPSRPGSLSGWGWGGGWIPRRLPLLPAWPGFVVNTMLSAAAVWVALWVPLRAIPAWRRGRWRRRGRCERCGYVTSGLSMCPECGPTQGAGL